MYWNTKIIKNRELTSCASLDTSFCVGVWKQYNVLWTNCLLNGHEDPSCFDEGVLSNKIRFDFSC